MRGALDRSPAAPTRRRESMARPARPRFGALTHTWEWRELFHGRWLMSLASGMKLRADFGLVRTRQGPRFVFFGARDGWGDRHEM